MPDSVDHVAHESRSLTRMGTLTDAPSSESGERMLVGRVESRRCFMFGCRVHAWKPQDLTR